MSDRNDSEDPTSKVPDIDVEGRDSTQSDIRDTASRESLSKDAFGQDSDSSIKQSFESMGQSLKKGSESAMAQFGQIALFDSQESKNDKGKEQARKQEKSNDTVTESSEPAANSAKKNEKKGETGDEEFDRLFDPVKQAQQAKESAEKEAKQIREFDQKAASRTQPKEGEALDPEASKEGTKDYLKNLPDLDYKNVLKGHQVTLLGENHLDSAAKDHIAEFAKNMKEGGATHFATETILQSMQPTLDKFMSGDKDARNEIEKHIMNTWNDSYPGSGEKYMKMLDAVKDSGMKIVGMDVNGHIDRGENGRTERDKAWSDSIANILKNDPSAKVVSFCGSSHFERNTAWTKSTNELLKNNHNIDAQVLNLSGLSASKTDKHDERIRSDAKDLHYRLRLYGQEAGQDKRSIMVPLAPKSDSKYDGFIFVPHK